MFANGECRAARQRRYFATQGIHGDWVTDPRRRSILAALIAGAPAVLHAAAAWRTVELQPLGANLWWVPGREGDADAVNRGHVSHLLVLRDGARVWLIGSGPSPAFGAVLARRIVQVAGRAVTDVVNPWAHPELVLGNAAFPEARLWAHADVADAMTQRCEGCVRRLRTRMGTAAVDLGNDPVRVPGSRLRGEEGRLGPWTWWRLSRGAGNAVTLLWHDGLAVVTAHGLLWAGAAPDLRDADLEATQASTTALGQRLAGAGSGWRIVGEQGPLAGAAEVRAHVEYWQSLRRAVLAALARGDAETAVQPLEGVAPEVQRHPRHALNWQRAWRQLEAAALGGAVPPSR